MIDHFGPMFMYVINNADPHKLTTFICLTTGPICSHCRKAITITEYDSFSPGLVGMCLPSTTLYLLIESYGECNKILKNVFQELETGLFTV